VKLQRTFVAETSETTIRNHVAAFLERAGYEQVSSQPFLSYRRGSKLGSLTSFSPKRWKVNATVQTVSRSDRSTEVAVIFDIDTTGQWVTDKERSFWDTELNGLEASVRSDTVDITVSSDLAQWTYREDVITYIGALGIMAIAVVGVYIVSQSTFHSKWLLVIALGGYLAGRWVRSRTQ
jgi:hypothetical protein